MHPRKEQEKPAEADLATVLMRCWEDHAKDVASAPSIRGHLAYWSSFFGAASVAEATSFQAMPRFKEHLKGRNLKPQTSNHVLKPGRAALRMAWKRGEIAVLPPI